MFDINRPDIAVSRVVLRLLKSIENENEREAAVSAILPSVKSYSSKLDLIQLVGHQENAGAKIVSEAYARKVEKAFVKTVLASPPPAAESEWNAIRVYLYVAQETAKPPLKSATDKSLIRAVFKSAMYETHSQSFDSRVAKRSVILGWDVLLTVFGDDNEIRNAVNLIRTKKKSDDVVEIVDKYLGGWRPARD